MSRTQAAGIPVAGESTQPDGTRTTEMETL